MSRYMDNPDLNTDVDLTRANRAEVSAGQEPWLAIIKMVISQLQAAHLSQVINGESHTLQLRKNSGLFIFNVGNGHLTAVGLEKCTIYWILGQHVFENGLFYTVYKRSHYNSQHVVISQPLRRHESYETTHKYTGAQYGISWGKIRSNVIKYYFRVVDAGNNPPAGVVVESAVSAYKMPGIHIKIT